MESQKKVRYKNFRKHLKQELSKDTELSTIYQYERIKLQFAHVLAEIRDKMKMTQRQLARRMGVSQQVISRIESGTENITLETLVRLLYSLQTVFQIRMSDRKRKRDTVVKFVEA